MYVISYTAKSKKYLSKLPENIRNRIIKKVNCLKPDPFRNVKRLQGKNFWRLRIEDYRAVLDIIIKDKKIIVLRIDHRKNIYKK
tara:strand:- start:39 stop:290 length:252 start_codon:yes stop_codon:yes gene_type:complete